HSSDARRELCRPRQRSSWGGHEDQFQTPPVQALAARKCLNRAPISAYRFLSGRWESLAHRSLSLQNDSFCVPALGHRTQEVGGSNPPSSIASSPCKRATSD